MKNQSGRASVRNTPGFIFYQSYYEALSKLKPRQRHAVLDAILEYAFSGVKPELDGSCGAIFTVIVPNLESCMKRYADSAGRGKRTAENIPDDGRKDPEKKECPDKHPDEDKSKSEISEKRQKRIIDKDKEKEKKKERDMDKGVYTEKETDNEDAAASASEKAAPQSFGRAKPSDGNTRPQSALCSRIISDYSGGDPGLRSLLNSWLDIKKQRGQPINGESIRLNLEELTRITEGGDKKAYLREVIRRGWGTFFELEKKGSRQDGGSGKDGNPGKGSGGGRESSLDIEEFDSFTLGTPV